MYIQSLGTSSKSLLVLSTVLSVGHSIPTPRSDLSTTADYVIVGGGPAGFVLAERLSRDSTKSIVLLEAGPDTSTQELVETPGDAFSITDLWMYPTEAEPNLGGRNAVVLQGKALGGGSAVNDMLYCRGAASVFDDWAEISGNSGLSWDDGMFQAFKDTSYWDDEASINYTQALNTTSFGTGPLAISRQRELIEFDVPFFNKLQSELGLPEIDFSSGQSIGVTQGINTVRASNRTRSYAYNTFGWIANTRSNFRLIHDAEVSKVNFEGTVTTGVTYTYNGTPLNNQTDINTTHTISAPEVVIAAGAIKSPQLLMLSGVGPKEHLESLGIEVVLDSPEVGQNLADHYLAPMQWEAAPSVGTLWQSHSNATRAAIEQARYAADGSGLLGTVNGDVMAALRVPDSVFDGIDGSFYINQPADRPHLIYEYSTANALVADVSAITAFVAVVQPEGKGNISLASADYRDAPVIHANYYGSEADRAAILYGVRQLRSIVNSPEMSGLTVAALSPTSDVQTDEELWASIQSTSGSFSHQMGTTALGTVLDANWRVKGVEGLRVIGSSAAPTITTCQTQGPAYALGHRAALDIVAADGLQ